MRSFHNTLLRKVAALAVSAGILAGLAPLPGHAERIRFSEPSSEKKQEEEKSPRQELPRHALDSGLAPRPSLPGSLSPVPNVHYVPPPSRQVMPSRQALEEWDQRRNWMFVDPDRQRREISPEEAFGVRDFQFLDRERQPERVIDNFLRNNRNSEQRSDGEDGSRREQPGDDRWNFDTAEDRFAVRDERSDPNWRTDSALNFQPLSGSTEGSLMPNQPGLSAFSRNPFELAPANSTFNPLGVSGAFQPNQRQNPFGNPAGANQGNNPWNNNNNWNREFLQPFDPLGGSTAATHSDRLDPINSFTDDRTSQPVNPIAPLERSSAFSSAFSDPWNNSASTAPVVPRDLFEDFNRGAAASPRAGVSSGNSLTAEPPRSIFQPFTMPPPTRPF